VASGLAVPAPSLRYRHRDGQLAATRAATTAPVRAAPDPCAMQAQAHEQSRTGLPAGQDRR